MFLSQNDPCKGMLLEETESKAVFRNCIWGIIFLDGGGLQKTLQNPSKICFCYFLRVVQIFRGGWGLL